MLVTDIKKSFPYKKLNEVYIDFEFSFALYDSELRKFKIELNKEIEKDFLENEIYPYLKKKALNDALKMVLRADTTVKNVKEKLTLKKYPSFAIDNALEYLETKGFVDDLEYAINFIKHSFNKGKGKKYVEFELAKRGIKNDKTEAFIEKYYKEDLICDVTDKKLISLIKGKDKPDYKDLNKLKDYLVRQGFCYDEVNEEILRVRRNYED